MRRRERERENLKNSFDLLFFDFLLFALHFRSTSDDARLRHVSASERETARKRQEQESSKDRRKEFRKALKFIDQNSAKLLPTRTHRARPGTQLSRPCSAPRDSSLLPWQHLQARLRRTRRRRSLGAAREDAKVPGRRRCRRWHCRCRCRHRGPPAAAGRRRLRTSILTRREEESTPLCLRGVSRRKNGREREREGFSRRA